MSGSFDANREDLVVGVIGAGAMGQGIVQVSLQGGMRVVLFDAKPGGAAAGADLVAQRLDRSAERGRLEPDAVAEMKTKLTVVDDLSGFAPCHAVVEAVFEDLDVKHAVYTELEKHVTPDCIIASNTSSLPISSLGRPCAHQTRFAGFHFFNPVPLMRLVEVIRGSSTEDWVVEGLVKLGERMGRTPVVVRDHPGFLVNTGGRAFTTEALHILHEGVAVQAQVDAVMRDCAHFRMGPFELMDLTGVDVNYPASLIMHEQNSYDPRIRTVPFHKSLHDAGRFGRKTGHGNYRYDEAGKMIDPPSPDHVSDAAPAERVFVAEGSEIFSDLLAGTAMTEIDDGESPIVAALYGEDCSTFAARRSLDHTRLVAIDPTGDLSKRASIMTPPGANPAARDAVAARLNANGRAVVAIKDSPGFIAQRMRAMIGNLGCEMAQIQLATPEDIDLAMRLGLNYPLGPLEIIDDFGTALAYRIMSTMQEITGDDRYRPSPWLRRRALLGLGAKVPS
jgi:3-hydroxybutyryl-CoA dehydrogenase